MNVASTLAGAVAASTLTTVLVTLPFTPARWWGWRLRKHVDTLKVLDANDARVANQREALLVERDRIASRLAAVTHIPTSPWWLRMAAFEVGFVLGLIASSVWMLAHGHPPWYGLAVPDYMASALAIFLWVSTAVALRASFIERRRQRRQFIKRGCPPKYPLRQTVPIAKSDALNALARDPASPQYRAYVRAGSLAATGAMPAHWPPMSARAAGVRRRAARRRGKPWYRGGFIRDPVWAPKAVAAQPEPT